MPPKKQQLKAIQDELEKRLSEVSKPQEVEPEVEESEDEVEAEDAGYETEEDSDDEVELVVRKPRGVSKNQKTQKSLDPKLIEKTLKSKFAPETKLSEPLSQYVDKAYHTEQMNKVLLALEKQLKLSEDLQAKISKITPKKAIVRNITNNSFETKSLKEDPKKKEIISKLKEVLSTPQSGVKEEPKEVKQEPSKVEVKTERALVGIKI